MNKIEHLLATLAEEAAEVTQACMKALRFGLSDGYPGTTRTNEDDIAKELTDMRATVALLRENGVELAAASDDVLCEAKKLKVTEYMAYAEARGTLDHAREEK